jgi:hypothetical protein
MKIRIFASPGVTSGLDIMEKMFESHLLDGYNNHYSFTESNDYTHVILMNTPMPNIQHIPKERVIGLAFEPIYYLGLTTEFVEYAEKYIGKYFIGDLYNLPKPFVEHYSYMWHYYPLSYIPIKKNIMSIVFSRKTQAPGHSYRHDLVQEILKTNLPIDIYGRGCIIYEKYNDPRLKGEFKEYEPYESYQYHIAIENFQSNRYFSEKIINSLLASTIPIYLGCKNIHDYFPTETINLTGNLKEDMIILHNICNNPSKYLKPIDVSKVKKTTNFLVHVENLFLEN